MADIAFPLNPADLEEFEAEGRTWRYDNATNTWVLIAHTTGVLTTAHRVDDDTFATASATTVPSSESVKAYVDGNLVTGAVTSVNGAAGVVVLTSDDISDDLQTNKWANGHIANTELTHQASTIGVVDAAGYFTASEVEPVLAELHEKSVRLAQVINAQTGTSYQFVAADAGKLVSTNNAAANTLTVPQDSDASIPIGTYIDCYQFGAGQTTVVAGTGATLRVSGLTAKARARYSRFAVQKVAANTWSLFGDLAAS